MADKPNLDFSGPKPAIHSRFEVRVPQSFAIHSAPKVHIESSWSV